MKFGFDNSGVAQVISAGKNWKEKGYYVIPTDPDWAEIPAGYERIL